MKSIRNYLLISVLSVVLISLMIFSILTYSNSKHEVEEIYDSQLAQSTRLLYALISVDSVEPLATKKLYKKSLMYQVWHFSGELALHSQSAPESLLHPLKKGFNTANYNKKTWRTYTLKDSDKALFFVVAENLKVRNKLVDEITEIISLPYFIGVPVLLVLLWIFIGRGLSPLIAISAAIQARSPDNLEPINLPQLAQELQPIESAINGLFIQLNDAIEREKTFTDDAAHELRTPLATIKLHAQNAIQSKEESTRHQSLNLLDQSIEQATRTIEQLLHLARIQSLAFNTSQDAVAIDKVAREQVAQIDVKLEQKQQQLIFDCQEPLPKINGNDVLLRLLIRNLLENANLYTPEDGTIKLALRASNTTLILQIEDSGPGVSDTVYTEIFKRFHRERPGETIGSGLGLSIVSRITELHSAKIQRLEPSEITLKGFCLEISFPVAD